jgi:tRNA pseudouridine38-40 synthase
LRTIQQELETAIASIADTPEHPIAIICAGRTDKGVHATGQVIHFTTNAVREPHNWLHGINSKLPPDIRVTWVKPIPDTFDARRSALWRHYQYLIYNSPTRPSLLRNNVTWWCYGCLDAERMHTAAQSWMGEHDFSSFRDSDCQSKSPYRNLMRITVKRVGDLVVFDIIANAFLHHMVRNMVGTLVKIGDGSQEIAWSAAVLAAKTRTAAGATLAPSGLYLMQVGYPEF